MSNILKGFLLIFISSLTIGCKEELTEYQKLDKLYSQDPSKWPTPTVDSTIVWQELGMVPKPKYNGKKPSKAMLALGKQLFFDNRISQTKQFSCASCHHPDQNFTDNRRVSSGFEFKQGKRNAPTILNLSYVDHLFWDGRANSLEAQVLGPIQNPVEMNTPLDTVVARVSEIKGYRKAFKKVFKKNTIDINDIAVAIANYERSLVSRPSKFDYYLKKKRKLNESELRGLHLFRTKAKCMNCHNGPLLTDNKFHNLGLTYYGRKYEDLGRYEVTKKAEDIGKFRTPSLRDVMRTRPWMHNGLFDNMTGILNMYNMGMPRPKRKKNQLNDSLFPQTSKLLTKLELSKDEIQDIIAFLHSISSPSYRVKLPKKLQ